MERKENKKFYSNYKYKYFRKNNKKEKNKIKI